MNARRAEILLRRQQLLVQVAAQRAEVAQIVEGWRRPLRVVNAGLSVLRFLRAHPVAVALTAGLVAARRRKLKGLTKMAWRLWGIYRLFLMRGTAAPRS